MIGKSLLLFLAFCFLATEISAFQWDESSLRDNEHIYPCSKSNLTLMWSYTSGTRETLDYINWFVQKEGNHKELIGVFMVGRFLTDDQRVQYVPPAGININPIDISDNGVYSVEVKTLLPSGQCDSYVRSVTVSVAEPPEIANGQLTASQRFDIVRNEKTAQWFVQLECGRFTSLGQPPVAVHWTTPSGQTYNSSGFENGTFLLNLINPAELGQYTCQVDNVTQCPDAQRLDRASLDLQLPAHLSRQALWRYLTDTAFTVLETKLTCSRDESTDLASKLTASENTQYLLWRESVAQKIGLLSLAGGLNRGRVEVYNRGSWGTVCDDNFGILDAKVVCRQLSLPSDNPQVLTNVPPGSGSILMDDVRCTGSELRLIDCPFRGFGVHDCGHSEDVGVYCR